MCLPCVGGSIRTATPPPLCAWLKSKGFSHVQGQSYVPLLSVRPLGVYGRYLSVCTKGRIGKKQTYSPVSWKPRFTVLKQCFPMCLPTPCPSATAILFNGLPPPGREKWLWRWFFQQTHAWQSQLCFPSLPITDKRAFTLCRLRDIFLIVSFLDSRVCYASIMN